MAAPILSWEGLGLLQGNGWLFQDLDIHIQQRDRLALIGRNGAGKTTTVEISEGHRGREPLQPARRCVGGVLQRGGPKGQQSL